MIGGLIAGLVIGFVVGVAATLVYVRRSRTPVTPARETAPRPAIAPEPAVAEPLPGVAPEDDDVHAAVDAAAGLLDELETRYRDRPAPVGDDDEPAPPVRRRPRRPRP